MPRKTNRRPTSILMNDRIAYAKQLEAEGQYRTAAYFWESASRVIRMGNPNSDVCAAWAAALDSRARRCRAHA